MLERYGPFVAALTLFSIGALAEPASSRSDDSESQQFVERQTFQLINAYRERQDLPALHWNEDITKLARAHSRDMAEGKVDFGHAGFSDRLNRLKSLVPDFRGAAENVFYASDRNEIAVSAVQGWLHSPHHLKNIRGDYDLSGLGVAISPSGMLYFTQIFLKGTATRK